MIGFFTADFGYKWRSIAIMQISKTNVYLYERFKKKNGNLELTIYLLLEVLAHKKETMIRNIDTLTSSNLNCCKSFSISVSSAEGKFKNHLEKVAVYSPLARDDL